MIIRKIFYLVKKAYLWLFNFMLDKQTREFYRLFVHVATILLLFVWPYVFISNVITLLTEDIYFTAEFLLFAFFFFTAPVIFACGVKFTMRFLAN